MDNFYKTFQNFEFSGEKFQEKKKHKKKKIPAEVGFTLTFIVDVYQCVVLWFPMKHDGLFGGHTCRHVKFITCFSDCVGAPDYPGG